MVSRTLYGGAIAVLAGAAKSDIFAPIIRPQPNRRHTQILQNLGSQSNLVPFASTRVLGGCPFGHS